MSELRKCLECGEYLPSEETTYILSQSGYVCDKCLEDCYFTCEGCNKYHHLDNAYYIDSEGIYVCESCYYESYGRCTSCDYRMRIEDMYYYCGDYYCPDCYNDCEDEEIIDEYHCGGGRGDYSKDYRYRVGVELEREDRDTKESIDTYKLRNDYGWVVESDSSLDSFSGFEAISPILPLRLGDLEKLFSDEDIRSLVRAEYTSDCGGHMTISDTKRNPDQLIDDIAGYLPILYALFPNRTTNHYCEPREKDFYKVGGRYALNKRGSYKGDGLEIRLFDAPKDEVDLMNRFRLLKFMLSHRATTIEQGLRLLSESKKLRKVVKNHLDMYEIAYKDFYSNLVRYAREIDKIRLRNIDIEDIDSILNR